MVFCSFYQVIFGVTIPIHYEIMSLDFIQDRLKLEKLILADQAKEYLPAGHVLPPAPPPSTIEIQSGCRVSSVFPAEISKKVMDADTIVLHLQPQLESDCKIIYNQFINPFTEIFFSQSGKIGSSKDSTYILYPFQQEQIITIKRIGLIRAIIKYIRHSKDNPSFASQFPLIKE